MTQRAPAGSSRGAAPGVRQLWSLEDLGDGAGKSLRSAVRWCAGCDNEQLLLRGRGRLAQR